MRRFAYNLLLHLYGLYALPRMAWDAWRKKKYRQSFLQRFGFSFPTVQKRQKGPTIWIHAVSVGEGRAVAPLVSLLRQAFPQATLLLSSVTEAGFADKLATIAEADYHVYLPFDLPYVIGPIVRRVKPDLLILSETDFWFNLLQVAKNVGAATAVVNGKLSARSLKRYQTQWLKGWASYLWKQIDLFCVQSTLHKERFIQAGVLPKSIEVTGNMKLDADYPLLTMSERRKWQEKLGIVDGDLVLVIGSTHEGEEALLLPLIQQWQKDYPTLKLVIAPRHLDRCAHVATLLGKQGIPFKRWSSGEGHGNLTLLDAVGKLKLCYQFATVALIAGSLVPGIGGHNLIEPCFYGVPVVYGPYVSGQQELSSLVSFFEAGYCVTLDQLDPVIRRLLDHPEERAQIGKNGIRLCKESKGASDKTLKALCQVFDQVLFRGPSQ